MSAPPPPAEVAAGSDFSLLRRLWAFVRPDAWAVGLALALTPVITGLQIAQPWLVKRVIDEHLLPGVEAGLLPLAALYFAAVVGSYATEAAYALALAWAGQRGIRRLRERLYAHTLGLPLGFFDKQPAGRLLTRLTSDMDALGESIAAGTVSLLLDVVLIVGILAAMVSLDLRLTLVLLALCPPLLVMLEWMRRRIRALFGASRDAQSALNTFLAERVDGVQVVQLFGDQARTSRRFAELNARFAETTRAANLYDAGMFALVDGAARIFTAVVLFVGAGLAAPLLGGAAGPEALPSVGLLVAFVDYIDRMFRPVRELSGKITIVQRAVASLSRVFWLFDAAAPVPRSGLPAGEVRGALELRGVRFRYGPDAPTILDGIDLRVRPGESVALVGATGAGKTTLLRLLDRSYDGYEGEILLDGVEIRSLSLDDHRRAVLAVRQDVQVFAGTVAFNVGLDNPEISAEDRATAVDRAAAGPLVERLGWDGRVAARGADLSAGEGQLLTFARVLAHAPAVLLLDEATASVDSMTEARVQQAIDGVIAGRTVLVVAHRLSTVQRCDRIVVLDRGRIVEEGPPDVLRAQGGAWARLLAAGEGLVGPLADGPGPR